MASLHDQTRCEGKWGPRRGRGRTRVSAAYPTPPGLLEGTLCTDEINGSGAFESKRIRGARSHDSRNGMRLEERGCTEKATTIQSVSSNLAADL